MSKAKALQAAVFAVANATYVNPPTVHGTEIIVGLKFGRYYVAHNDTMIKSLDRNEAISTIVEMMTA